MGKASVTLTLSWTGPFAGFQVAGIRAVVDDVSISLSIAVLMVTANANNTPKTNYHGIQIAECTVRVSV